MLCCENCELLAVLPKGPPVELQPQEPSKITKEKKVLKHFYHHQTVGISQYFSCC